MNIFLIHVLIGQYIRKNLTPTSCVLCGKEKILNDDDDEKTVDYCSCPSSIGCGKCDEDIAARASSDNKFGVLYRCPYHGQYRHYEDGLMRYKVCDVK